MLEHYRRIAIRRFCGPCFATRTADALDAAVDEALRAFTTKQCMNYSASSGYDAV